MIIKEECDVLTGNSLRGYKDRKESQHFIVKQISRYVFSKWIIVSLQVRIIDSTIFSHKDYARFTWYLGWPPLLAKWLYEMKIKLLMSLWHRRQFCNLEQMLNGMSLLFIRGRMESLTYFYFYLFLKRERSVSVLFLACRRLSSLCRRPCLLRVFLHIIFIYACFPTFYKDTYHTGLRPTLRPSF